MFGFGPLSSQPISSVAFSIGIAITGVVGTGAAGSVAPIVSTAGLEGVAAQGLVGTLPIHTYLFFLDNQDMTMSIAISGRLPNAIILGLFNQGYFDFKPAGVQILRSLTTVDGAPVFGFGVDNQYIGGWGKGAWASIVRA